MNSAENFVWAEKYRPKKVADTILPKDLKQTFQNFVDDGNIPNLLLSGRAGTGKTTIAKAMLEELDCDYITINGSMSGNIDTLRTDIMNFSSSVSFKGGRKYVILDEADHVNPNSTQPALRNFMEEYSKNCGFIFTCNFKNRIIDPLHSRCSVIDFQIPKKEKAELASQFFKRVCNILDNEGIEYNKKVIADLVQLHFPDWRRTLNELQSFSKTGKIDSEILVNHSHKSIKDLMKIMKEKDFEGMRKWVAENQDIESEQLFRNIYENAVEYFEKNSIPGLVITLGEYQYKEAFVADSEINLAACLTEIMFEATFK